MGQSTETIMGRKNYRRRDGTSCHYPADGNGGTVLHAVNVRDTMRIPVTLLTACLSRLPNVPRVQAGHSNQCCTFPLRFMPPHSTATNPFLAGARRSSILAVSSSPSYAFTPLPSRKGGPCDEVGRRGESVMLYSRRAQSEGEDNDATTNPREQCDRRS